MYALKQDEHFWPVKAKSRLVACGNRQVAGLDFDADKIYSPTVAVSCVRLLAAIACELDWGVYHSDVEQAFVRSFLNEDEQVFVKLPRGCGRLSGKIVRLIKSLYGLKQAAKHWFDLLCECLFDMGLERCRADTCVFRMIEDGKVVMLVAVHVDDIFSAGERDRCEKFAMDLNKRVPVKFLGELKVYSGLVYERDWDAGLLKISQEGYAMELVKKFGVEGEKDVPLSKTMRLDEWKEGDDLPDSVPFRELVGGLMWLGCQTRPDIAHAVRAVARYSAAPKIVHWGAAVGILEYVKRTASLGITFERGALGGVSLMVFSDADYASKANDRRSVSGGVVMCGGAAVCWFSRTQRCVTLSTSEAEYVAATDAVKELLFLRQVWRFMLPEMKMPCVPLFEDNQGAIKIAQNPINNSNSKHIDVRYHFIRELVESREISIIYVPSADQHADFLTKALDVVPFERHRRFVMNSE